MARIFKIEIEVTDEEFSNFLSRMSGEDGRKVTPQVVEATEDDGPAAIDAPETDKNGVAWDERFHASSKAVNADGTWRRKRGLSPEETAAAEEYEKGATATATVTVATDVAPVPDTPEPVAPVLPTPTMPGMPGLPVAPVAPEPVSYEEVVKLYQAAVAKNPALDVPGLYANAGVTDPTILNTDAGAPFRIELAKLFREV